MSADRTPKKSALPRKQVLRFDRRDRPGESYFVYVPSPGGQGSPLFVAVHGISRNAFELAQTFAGYCEECGAVLVAPLFTEDHSGDYQRLGRAGRGPRADAALDSILEEVEWLTGADATQIHLFGHSGGAQFAHRYAMAYPHRVARAAIASAGWYTFPDRQRRYPYGIRSSQDLPDVRFDPEDFLRVPITVLVGERDITPEHMRSTDRVNRQQGETRVERARNWVAAMRAEAKAHHVDSLVSLELIPDGDHSFTNLVRSGRLGERVFSALFGAALGRAAMGGHA